MNKIILSFFLLALSSMMHGQGVGIGTNVPEASAILELKSTTKGFLPSRMTAAQKAAIVTPKAGLIVYQTDGATGLYVFNGATWETIAGVAAGNGWSIHGNSGTLETDFLGTVDDRPLRFRINNLPSGIIDAYEQNTSFGYNAMGKAYHALENTGIGWQALAGNTSGSYNTAIGSGAMSANLTGNNNVGGGTGPLIRNTTGNRNTAIGNFSQQFSETTEYNVSTGFASLSYNETGSANVAIGSFALQGNKHKSNLVAIGDSAMFQTGDLNSSSTGGGENVAVGAKSMVKNLSGAGNTATGYQSLYFNTDGDHNSAFGRTALYSNTHGSFNTGIGNRAMLANTTGILNTSLGYGTLVANTTGNDNLALGAQSLNSNVDGNLNVAVGFRAMQNNLSGIGNIAVGPNSMVNNIAGDYNVAIGNSASVWAGADINNSVALGAFSRADCNACVVLGSVNGLNGASSTSRVGIGQTAPTALLHLKQTIDAYPSWNGGMKFERHDNTNSWAIGVDYADDLDFTFNGAAKGYIRDVDGVYVAVSDSRMKKDISQVTTVLPLLMQLKPSTYHYKDNKADDPLAYGFMAQDVEKLFPSFVTTKGPDNMKGVAYQNFHVVAIKAIQEQQEIINSLRTKLDQSKEKMQSEIDLLKEQVKQIMQQLNTGK